MKVVCIKKIGAEPGNGLWWRTDKKYTKGFWFWKRTIIPVVKGPKERDVVTIDKEFWDAGEKYYLFIEWPGYGGYNSASFKPLQETYEEVKVSQIKEVPCEN
jgi:hypothetical protein